MFECAHDSCYFKWRMFECDYPRVVKTQWTTEDDEQIPENEAQEVGGVCECSSSLSMKFGCVMTDHCSFIL